jgi:hypothetical protein
MSYKGGPGSRRGGGHTARFSQGEGDETTGERFNDFMQRVVDVGFPWVAGVGVAMLVGTILVLAMPSNATARVALTPALLSAYECEAIVGAAEAVAAERGGWETERHRHCACVLTRHAALCTNHHLCTVITSAPPPSSGLSRHYHVEISLLHRDIFAKRNHNICIS